MTYEQEKKNVKGVAGAARAFLKCYDEFDDQPECCGEYLSVLVDAVDKLGDEGDIDAGNLHRSANQSGD